MLQKSIFLLCKLNFPSEKFSIDLLVCLIVKSYFERYCGKLKGLKVAGCIFNLFFFPLQFFGQGGHSETARLSSSGTGWCTETDTRRL